MRSTFVRRVLGCLPETVISECTNNFFTADVEVFFYGNNDFSSERASPRGGIMQDTARLAK